MAERDHCHAITGPRRQLGAAHAQKRLEAPARQALQAADEEEGFIGERQACLPIQRAALRTFGLRAGSAAAGASAVFLLGARGRRPAECEPAASRLFFSASMMLTTLAGAACSGTTKTWPACLARSMAVTASS